MTKWGALCGHANHLSSCTGPDGQAGAGADSRDAERGRESARVLRRALILRQLDQGAEGGPSGELNVGVAPKTVRAIARRYEEEGLESALRERPRPGKQRALDAGPEPTHHRHGVLATAGRPGAVDGAADRPGSGEAKTGAARGTGDGPHPAPEAMI